MKVTLSRLAVTILIVSSLFTGCVYAKIRVPLDTDVSTTRMGEKIGKANAYSIAWLFAWGDASTAAAAKNGDIETINHLDSEHFSLLFGLYYRKTTIAYGD